MTPNLFEPSPLAGVPIAGADALFPVRRIMCVGRNYAAHRREMGGDDRDPPFFFSKPADAVVVPGQNPSYPTATSNLHYEIELVVAIGARGSTVPVETALDIVYGYAVGVDLTRRDLQNAAKEKGHPWDASKGFDQSAPISAIVPWVGAPPSGKIWLSVNASAKQEATIADMIWNVAEIVAQASKLWTLAPGDLIFTGTPEGVGPLVRGDRVTGGIEGVGEISFTID
ncbi:MAG: fumarylacetoacetate hydrolase family protein [Pseudomonadota bacterium]